MAYRYIYRPHTRHKPGYRSVCIYQNVNTITTNDIRSVKHCTWYAIRLTTRAINEN